MTTEDFAELPTVGDLRCPTCGAAQEWSNVCRRCRCDLTLLQSVAESSRLCRRHCLLALQVGRIPEALGHAQRLYAIGLDESAARLLAVCHLFQGNWRAPVTVARPARPRAAAPL